MPDSLDYSKLFAGRELTTSNAELFTMTTAQGTLRNLVLGVSNKTSSTALYDVYVVPAGGSPGDDGTNVHIGASIPGNSYREIPIPKMVAGDSLHAKCSTGANIIEVFDADGVTRA